MAKRSNRTGRRAYRGRDDWTAIILIAFAAGAILLLPTVRDAWRRSNERAGRALTMEEARETNASVPFVAEQGSARAFRFHGSPAAREQAVQCLATAAVYEAGHDERGQEAVMQVVLNRLGRPGYPKTVCGVVYQGAARATGCQFSFSCDGSQARRPERAGWSTARTAARRALSGHVFRPVGAATHYHADWVVPYWIDSLDKVAQVNSHIFYRPRQHAGV
jgi:spore germination cell wall hydrolase CwlJ-like protein